MKSRAFDFKKKQRACIKAFKDPSLIDPIIRQQSEFRKVPYMSKTFTIKCSQQLCSKEDKYVLPISDYMKEHMANELAKKIIEVVPMQLRVEQSGIVCPYTLVGRMDISVNVPYPVDEYEVNIRYE